MNEVAPWTPVPPGFTADKTGSFSAEPAETPAKSVKVGMTPGATAVDGSFVRTRGGSAAKSNPGVAPAKPAAQSSTIFTYGNDNLPNGKKGDDYGLTFLGRVEHQQENFTALLQLGAYQSEAPGNQVRGDSASLDVTWGAGPWKPKINVSLNGDLGLKDVQDFIHGKFGYAGTGGTYPGGINFGIGAGMRYERQLVLSSGTITWGGDAVLGWGASDTVVAADVRFTTRAGFVQFDLSGRGTLTRQNTDALKFPGGRQDGLGYDVKAYASVPLPIFDGARLRLGVEGGTASKDVIYGLGLEYRY